MIEWFWLYVGLTIILLLVALTYTIMIAAKRGYNQPGWKTKV